MADRTIKLYDSFAVTDRPPQKADSNFFIGYTAERDRTYKSVLPLGLNYDVERSEIPIMPPTEHTYIDMPFVDGSMITHTKYLNRPFKIVAWSDDGLTKGEIEQLKYEITRFLDSTKEHSRKLTIQETGTTFDVKYSGQAVTEQGPSFIRVTMPFESGPYGYPSLAQEVYGNGILINHGDKEMPFINEISEGCINPHFTIGTVEYSYTGTVPTGKKLVINHENLTCDLVSSNGTKENVIKNLTGDFQTVPKGQSVTITADAGTASHLCTRAIERVLWKKSGDN